MGIDWQSKCAPTWERTWDRGRVELSKPNLFTQTAPPLECTFRAKPRGPHEFKIGDTYQLRVEGEFIRVIYGVVVVGDSVMVSTRILKTIRERGGDIACGIVRDVFEFSKAADIAVL
jgi:hypothetical protein